MRVVNSRPVGDVVGPCLPSLPDKQEHLDCCAAVPRGPPVLRWGGLALVMFAWDD